MKNLSDGLQRFLFENAPIRGELVRLDTVWQSVLERHDYPDVLRNLMGELCAAAVLLAATLKLQGSLILQIQGQGAVKLLVVECTGDLQLRATAKWSGELEGTLAELVGDGLFVITLDLKDGGQAYQGIVEMEGESVAEIMQNYMLRSEQLETRLWLAADGQCAAGMLLQKLPENAKRVEDVDAWGRATFLADTLKSQELLQEPALTLLRRLYHEEDLRVLEEQEVTFHCSCSRHSVAQMLRLLGPEEVQDILKERGSIEVFCEFCNQRYEFDKIDVELMFVETVASLVSDVRH